MARVRAPELSGQGGWIGASADFGLTSVIGKVVVLHFFTTSCINCVRVLEELRPIEDRFSAEAVVLGIHSPKFPREHEHSAVQRSVQRLRIRHPVLDDPDLTTWQQYGIKGWPTVVVVDPEGYVVGGIAGEGSGPVVFSSVESTIAEHDAKGTLVRGPVAGLWGATTVPTTARPLRYPGKVAVDRSGRRFAVSDSGNGRVVVCDLRGRVEQMYPLLSNPQGVCFDGDRLVVCDAGTDRVIAIDRATGSHEVVASGLASPWDVTVLADGSLLVAEAGRHRLRRLPGRDAPPPPEAATDLEGATQAEIVAGTGQENLLDGPAVAPPGWPDPVGEAATAPPPALLAQPSGLAALAGGGAVFVDAESSALRVLTPEGDVVTLVGQGLFDWGASDGGPDAAALQHPMAVAVGPVGDGGIPVVYVADTFNGKLREWTGTAWTAAAGTLRTLPVTGLEEPSGLAWLPDGRLVVADTNHHEVALIDPETGALEVVQIDESWLGTTPGDPIDALAGEPVSIPYELDPGDLTVDGSDGPPVRVNLSSEPGSLLGPGPRRWALADPKGTVEVTAGTAGEGILIMELEIDTCDDNTCTVLTSRGRHDLSVAPADTA